ncbi:hypothetical protein YC2023_081665 [Brassica napus]
MQIFKEKMSSPPQPWRKLPSRLRKQEMEDGSLQTSCDQRGKLGHLGPQINNHLDVPRFVDQSIGVNQHGSSKDICSLFDSYLPNLDVSTHEITWRMFLTQLRNSSNKNQIK